MRTEPELKTACFGLQEDFDMESLQQSLTFPVQFLAVSSAREQRVYYDTFEWQLFQHGIAVASRRRHLCLFDLQTGLESASERFSVVPAHFMASSLSPGPFRSALEKVTGVRALLRRSRIDTDRAVWKVLDGEEKTTGILVSETYFMVRGGIRARIAGMLQLRPLKGFRDETGRLARHIEEWLGRESVSCFSDIYRLFMEAAGKHVNDYSSKIRLSLRPADPVRKSAALLLLAALDVMRRNEPWISRNVDMEFLHDYRVAIRRTRSLLGQLKGTFSPASVAPFRTLFKDAGKQCNTLMDCDVYLLRETAYRAMLPCSLSAHIGVFFDELQAIRAAEMRGFSAYLRSASFRSRLAEWEAFLRERTVDHALADDTGDGLRSTIEVARKATRKAWKKVISHGRSIPSCASDRELHALRIDCKKLRYLLEFFTSVFPEKTAGRAIRHLKELQENLGSFVDLAVQQQYLLRRIETMKNRQPDAELAAALGGLVAILHDRQEKERESFAETFRRFDNDEAGALLKDLLNNR